jgi:hypothetical protein
MTASVRTVFMSVGGGTQHIARLARDHVDLITERDSVLSYHREYNDGLSNPSYLSEHGAVRLEDVIAENFEGFIIVKDRAVRYGVKPEAVSAVLPYKRLGLDPDAPKDSERSYKYYDLSRITMRSGHNIDCEESVSAVGKMLQDVLGPDNVAAFEEDTSYQDKGEKVVSMRPVSVVISNVRGFGGRNESGVSLDVLGLKGGDSIRAPADPELLSALGMPAAVPAP